MAKNSEFDNFDRTMHTLMKLSHEELKAKLDAEKVTKRNKRKPKKTSASGRASGDKD